MAGILQLAGSGRAGSVRRAVLVSTLLSLLSCGSLWATRLACGVEQLSHAPLPQIPTEAVAMSRSGSQVLLLSRHDFTGQNADRNIELFWKDLESDEVAQLTHTRGANIFENGVSADDELNRIVFVSNRNPTGDNPGRWRQVFLIDANRGRFQQITRFTNNALMRAPNPRISGNGKVVVFASQESPVVDVEPVPDDGTPDPRSPQLYAYDIDHQSFLKVTELPQVSTPVAFSLSRNGRLLAMLVTHKLGGFSEIDLLNLESGASDLIVLIDQVYGEAGADDVLFLSEDGNKLFFIAATDLTGLNPDGGPDVFTVSVEEAATAIDTIAQVTQLVAGGLEAIAYSRDGTRVAIRSRSDLSDWQGNGASNVFSLDVESGVASQVTHLNQPSRGAGRIFSNRDGSRLLFSSADDLVGFNSDGTIEAFRVLCEQAREAYFPQIGYGLAGGLRFVTNFVFVNPGYATSLLVQFFDRTGEPMTVDLGEHGAGSVFNFQIQRGTPLFLETAARQALAVGYARVYAGPSLNGNAVFTGSLHATDTILFEAAVPMTEPVSDFTLVVTNQNNYKTGLAMVNTADAELPAVAFIPTDGGQATVRLRLYDRFFSPLAERTFQLAPGQHRDLFVADFFENAQNRSTVRNLRGVLTVSSTQPLAVIALRQNDDPSVSFPKKIPTLTTYPVAKGRPEKNQP